MWLSCIIRLAIPTNHMPQAYNDFHSRVSQHSREGQTILHYNMLLLALDLQNYYSRIPGSVLNFPPFPPLKPVLLLCSCASNPPGQTLDVSYDTLIIKKKESERKREKRRQL